MREEASGYARLELERRYLVAGPTADEADASDAWQIVDRYITGTRLRLRRMAPPDGGSPLLKLNQKEPVRAGAPSLVRSTTLSLNEAEFALLYALPAHELRKERRRVEHDGRTYAIDRFAGPLRGLVLAETELAGEDAFAALAPHEVRHRLESGAPGFSARRSVSP